jgi:hypothetical protein
VRTAAADTERAPGGGGSGGRDGEGTAGGGPVAEPEGANSIVLLGQDSFPDENDGLVVTITVGNEGMSRATALVEVVIDAGGEELVVERFVDLQPGQTRRLRFTPDATYDQYSGHVPRVRSETPETPIPSPTPSPTASPSPTDTPTPTDSPTQTPTDTGTGDETTE